MINNGNRTEWNPIRSVIILVIKQIGLPISLITRMIKVESNHCNKYNRLLSIGFIHLWKSILTIQFLVTTVDFVEFNQQRILKLIWESRSFATSKIVSSVFQWKRDYVWGVFSRRSILHVFCLSCYSYFI